MDVLRRGAIFLITLSLVVGVPHGMFSMCYAQSAEEHCNKGIEYGARGEFEEAQDEFERALEIDQFYEPAKQWLEIIEDVYKQEIKSETAIRLLKGTSCIMKGTLEGAISEYKKAIEINPDYARSYNALGLTYVLKGMLDEAIQQLKKAIEIDPDYANAHYNLGLVYYWYKGMPDEAILEWRSATEIDPNYAQAHLNLGLAYEKKGALNRAISEYEKATKTNPNYVKAYYNLGNVYRAKGMLDEAILEYKKAIEMDPNYAPAHLNLGVTYRKKGMTDEAISEYKKAIKVKPSLAEAHNNLGNAYSDKGMLDEAITEYKKAIEINLNYAEAYSNLGKAYHEKRMLDEAITEYKKAIEINLNYAGAHYNLGNAYYDKDMLDQAITEYKKAIEIDPDYANAHYNLGVAYYDKGMLDEAILQYKKAIDINPNLAKAHNNLGNAYVDKGMFDEAVLECKKAIDINPNLADAHYNLAVAYYYKGQYDLAIEHCGKAIELGCQVLGEEEIKWKTYHNYEYGWSINYPSDWEIDKSNPEAVGFTGKGGINLIVGSEELASPTSVEEYFNLRVEGTLAEEYKKRGFSYFSKVSERKVEIGAERAIEAIYLGGKSSDNPWKKQRFTVVVRDGIAYMVVCTVLPIFYDQANEVYFGPMIQNFTIGLDLEEGAYLIYQVDYERIDPQEVTGGAMEEVKKKVEHRIGEYPGINGATVQRQGEDKILVQLPGVKDINEAIELIGKTAQLDFREWKGEEDKWVPAKEIVDGEEVELTGALLKPECKAALDRNDNPVVIFHWNKEGAEIFEQVTKRNIGKRLGIFLDDELISAPTIRTVIKGEGIIEGLTWDEAKNLAIQLNSGALDVPLKLISSGKMSTLQAASYD